MYRSLWDPTIFPACRNDLLCAFLNGTVGNSLAFRRIVLLITPTDTDENRNEKIT